MLTYSIPNSPTLQLNTTLELPRIQAVYFRSRWHSAFTAKAYAEDDIARFRADFDWLEISETAYNALSPIGGSDRS